MSGLTRILLVVVAMMVSLGAVEGALRILRPDLGDLVGDGFEQSRYRIHANSRNHVRGHHHPEHRRRHLVIRNSLGLRQHREFEATKAPGTVRIGVFGDSFTENLRLPVPFSFTEPLDYLLNRTKGRRYEVLNFGTDGYGTDQIYLHYMDEGTALDLDVVVYVFCHNDLQDVLADRLFDVDGGGNLLYLPARPSGPVRDLVRRSYLTYFLLEASPLPSRALAAFIAEEYDPERIVDVREEKANRLRLRHFRTRHDLSDPSFAEAWRIFATLLSEMKAETARRNQRFVVALVPAGREFGRLVAERVAPLGIDVVDLQAHFEAEGVGLEPFFFRRDPHWNEEGNKLVAVHLFRALAERMGIDYGGERFIRKSLFEYYSAFDRSPIADRWLEPVEVPEVVASAIRAKVLSLDARYPAGDSATPRAVPRPESKTSGH